MRYLLIVFTFLFLTAEAPSPGTLDQLQGTKAPDFTLKDVNDKPVSLSSLRGNAFLITFWATWCPPCRNEMPSLNRLYKEYAARGLVVVGVATDRSVSSVRDFLSKHPVDFPVLLDTDSKVSRQFRVFSLPTSFLLDRNRAIIQRFMGEEEWDSDAVRSQIKTTLGIQ